VVAQSEFLLSLRNFHTGSGAHLAPYLMGKSSLFRGGVTRFRREVGNYVHLVPNEWSYASTPLSFLHVLGRKIFYFVEISGTKRLSVCSANYEVGTMVHVLQTSTIKNESVLFIFFLLIITNKCTINILKGKR